MHKIWGKFLGRTNFEEGLSCASLQVHVLFIFYAMNPRREYPSSEALEVPAYFFNP